MTPEMITCVFYLIVGLAFLGLLIYFVAIYRRVSDDRNEPADEESRKMYFETFKTVVTAAGLAIPIIGATLKNGGSHNLWMLQRAAMCLLAALALAVVTLLEMSRRYERARQGNNQPVESSLAQRAKEINQKINSTPGDYTEALKLALEYCRKRTGPVGLKQSEVGWLCLWAYLSMLGFIVGLLYVVRFVACF